MTPPAADLGGFQGRHGGIVWKLEVHRTVFKKHLQEKLRRKIIDGYHEEILTEVSRI